MQPPNTIMVKPANATTFVIITRQKCKKNMATDKKIGNLDTHLDREYDGKMMRI